MKEPGRWCEFRRRRGALAEECARRPGAAAVGWHPADEEMAVFLFIDDVLKVSIFRVLGNRKSKENRATFDSQFIHPHSIYSRADPTLLFLDYAIISCLPFHSGSP